MSHITLKQSMLYSPYKLFFQQLHCNSTNYNKTTHMTRNIHCTASKNLFDKTDQKFLERLKWWRIPYAAVARAAPPRSSPRRSVAPQLPRPSPEPPPTPTAPGGHPCAAPRGPRHVNTHKQTQTHTTYRVWVHKSCWTKNINSTLQWFICYNIIYVHGIYLFK